MTTLAPPASGTDRAARPLALGERLRATAATRAASGSWAVAATLGVIALSAVLYLVNLTISGYANEYYSAAALSGSQSWLSWFFGSVDAGNFITVDKPPLATMVMGLSVRIFGLSPASILVPEALMGVASVLILMAIVRRTFGAPASIIAGLVMALTPSAVLMFRYDNPDALLTLLLVGSAWAFLRTWESGHIRWLALAGVLVGLAFNTKLLQGWMVLPVFVITYAAFGPGSIGRRIAGLLVAAAATILASSWWVIGMLLVPAELRPYVGGSTNGTALDLILGYDGLGRIFGGSGNVGGGAGGGPSFSGSPGVLRLFNAEMGGQIAWFLPLAVVGLMAGVIARWRRPRADLARAAWVMWGLWLLVHAVVFSFMSGTIHSYYTVVMAPAVGALVGGGVVALWQARARIPWLGLVLAAAVAASAALAWTLLARTPAFAPGLGVAVLVAGLALAVVLILPTTILPRRLSLAATGLAVAVLLAGPAAYSLETIATAFGGGAVAAGPVAQGAAIGGPGGQARGANPSFGAFPTRDGARGALPADGFASGSALPDGTGGAQFFNRGGIGGSLSASAIQYLVDHRGTATWIVAVQSANSAAPVELSTGLPVMAMGGFTGSDPAPTLAQLQAYVASGQLRFVLTGGGGAPGGVPAPGGLGAPGDSGSSSIGSWVASSCTAVSGFSGLYDCAGAAA